MELKSGERINRMQENHKERERELFYIGKTIDTFCPALEQLMEYERLPKISSVDCVSLRAFGFCSDGGAEEWFRPLIDTESAVRKLGEVAEVPFSVVRLGKESSRMELPEAFVFGPVKYGIAAPAVSDRYYRGGGRYLFAQRREMGYEVFDPWGFPGLRMTQEELLSLADYQSGCCIIYLRKENCHRSRMSRGLSCETVLWRGVEYHKEIRGFEEHSIAGAVRRYAGEQRERISLRCGILNMIQMLDKVFLLAAKCGYQEIKTKYDERKQQLFHMAESGNIGDLPGILTCIWRSLENNGR